MRLRSRLNVLWLLGTALAVSGCTATPTWRPVDLGALQPSSLVAAGDELLVGGQASGGPALARLSPSGARIELALTADGPEAQAATLVRLAARGDQMQALGTMTSGAHSNPRWTVWDGSLVAGTLTSHPQEFFTFGGHDAGPLLGVDWVAGQPVILGSRTTATGARAALYQGSGTIWRELSDRPGELASTATSQLGFSALASTGENLVIGGDEVVLSQPLLQRPLIWVGRPGGAWTRLEPITSTTDGSGLARAQAAACSSDGSCWVAGWVHGGLVTWSVTTGTQPSVSGPELPAGTASVAVSSNGSSDPVPQLAIWQGRPIVAGNGAEAGLFVRCDAGWRSLSVPSGSPGPVAALASAGDRLYVLIGPTLWAIDRSPC